MAIAGHYCPTMYVDNIIEAFTNYDTDYLDSFYGTAEIKINLIV